MTGQVTVPLPARRKGRHGRARGADAAPRAPGTEPSPIPDRIPRIARVLALAHHWQGLLRTGAVRNQADLARLVGVSRARVTQVMDLLRLAPDIQDQILCSALAVAGIEHREALAVASDPLWRVQRARWSAGCYVSGCP